MNVVKHVNECIASCPLPSALPSHLYSLRFSVAEEGLFHLADPVAIEKFVSWIKKNSPYDLVIDGMNAFHCPKPNNVKFTKLMQSNVSCLCWLTACCRAL